MRSSSFGAADTREQQLFPILAVPEIDRLRRFGTPRSFAPGESMVRVGEAGHGLIVVLSGEVDIYGRDEVGCPHVIVTHQPGSFMGELAQVSGRASLVDAIPISTVEALVIPSAQLQALLVLEAELGERIMRALILRRVGLLETGAGGPVIVGTAEDPDVRRLQGFLIRNGHPLHQVDPAREANAASLLARFNLAPEELPVVICPDGSLLRNPTEDVLARCLGMVSPLDPGKRYDVIVIGAGPAGLAASVYAASEGLSVLALDCRSFGGQAGASARIENYLGFPTGISGVALMARAFNQARKFGVEMAIPDEVVRLEQRPNGDFIVTLANTEQVRGRAIVIATGARYRRPHLVGLETYEAASVHYWASPLEQLLCTGQEVVLVGGGNAAGQAVVYLANKAKKISLLIRGPGLAAGMSSYLVNRIESLLNVELVPNVEITELEGESGTLNAVHWRDVRSGFETRRETRHLFLFIGAEPNTNWLAGSPVRLDPKGFIMNGPAAGAQRAHEASVRGVFAIGDVRSGSVKRVAAAVGEGAQVVGALHSYFAEIEISIESVSQYAPPVPMS